MTPKLIKRLSQYLRLYRDPATGLAWVRNDLTGRTLSAHPRVPNTECVRTMKLKGLWKRHARTVEVEGYIYNLSFCSVNLANPLELQAMHACECGGVHYTLPFGAKGTTVQNAGSPT